MSSLFLSWRLGVVLVGLAACLLPPARAGLPIQHWTHASGAKVYLIESPGIPMIDVQIQIPFTRTAAGATRATRQVWPRSPLAWRREGLTQMACRRR